MEEDNSAEFGDSPESLDSTDLVSGEQEVEDPSLLDNRNEGVEETRPDIELERRVNKEPSRISHLDIKENDILRC